MAMRPDDEPEKRLHSEEHHKSNHPCCGTNQSKISPESAGCRRHAGSRTSRKLFVESAHASLLSKRCRAPNTPAATAAPTQLKTVKPIKMWYVCTKLTFSQVSAP